MILSTQDIFNTLNTGLPVSIIRAGDGEQIVLNSNQGINEYRLCVENVMKRQMGYEPTMSQVDAIRQNLIAAYTSADIIGIPMHKNLAEMNKHWRAVAESVSFAKTDKRCSIDVGYDMLYNGMLSDWLNGKHTVNYISCRDIDIQLKRRFGVKVVNSFIIAPEAKFTSGYTGMVHYPDQFNKIEWFMNACECTGNPCLVGAGVIGKIYTNWFRDRGGVAIDLGAVFDLWAGKSTRGAKRGLDAEDKTYIL